MRSIRVSLSALAMFLVAGMFLAGCGEETLTGVNATPVPDAGVLVEDPLDGVLNSTDGSTPADHGMRLDRLAQKLGLDEEQKAALKEAYKTFHDGLKALHAQVRSGDITVEDARAAAAVLREAFEAELQVILTPEQYEMLQEMRQNRDGRNHGMRDPHARWLYWLNEIGADEGQIADVMAALRTAHDALMDLRLAIKAGDVTREEAKTMVMDIRIAFDAALQDILTPEQYEALQELRPDERGKNHNDDGHGHRGGNGNGGDED
ncbi:MAG TPA: hypothetical protein VGC81_04700 [Candidatus Methylomirabilis sp.]